MLKAQKIIKFIPYINLMVTFICLWIYMLNEKFSFGKACITFLNVIYPYFCINLPCMVIFGIFIPNTEILGAIISQLAIIIGCYIVSARSIKAQQICE